MEFEIRTEKRHFWGGRTRKLGQWSSLFQGTNGHFSSTVHKDPVSRDPVLPQCWLNNSRKQFCLPCPHNHTIWTGSGAEFPRAATLGWGGLCLPSKVDEERQDIAPHYPAVPHRALALGLSFLNVVSSQAGEVPSGLWTEFRGCEIKPSR